MPRIVFEQEALLVDLPDLIVDGQTVLRKAELTQFIYEPKIKKITLVFDVVPFSASDGTRIQGYKLIGPYEDSVIADNSTIVLASDGTYICDTRDEYIDSQGHLNPKLIRKDYMYKYDWHNRNGWTVERIIMDGVATDIQQQFIPPETPVINPLEEDPVKTQIKARSKKS